MLLLFIPLDEASGHITTSAKSGGSAQAHGVLQIRDGTSNTVLIAEKSPANASCADTDGDGVAGVTSLQFSVRDVHTGQLLPISIAPVAGDVDDRTRHEATVIVGSSLRFMAWLTAQNASR